MNRMPGQGPPPQMDQPKLNPMPGGGAPPVPGFGGGPTMNPMPGAGGAPGAPEPPLRLNAPPGGAAPPPGYPPPGYGPGMPTPPGFQQQPPQFAFQSPPAFVPPSQQAYAPPPQPPPPVTLALGTPPREPAVMASVVPMIAVEAPPPKPPPPPPPRTQPYFRCGVQRDAHGRHVSPNGRHYCYRPPTAQHLLIANTPRIQLPPATLVPPLVDLRGALRPAREVSPNGSAAGFSTAAFREALHAVASNAVLPGYLSAAYIYARARTLEGSFPRDSGVSLADELLVLTQYGVCPEDFLPFDVDPAEEPTPACDTAAAMFRLSLPSSQNPAGISQVDWMSATTMKAVLAAKQPINVSFTAYSSFEEPDREGKLTMFDVSERVLGSLAVLIVGYNDYGWIARTHFGQSFGDKGHVFMPFDFEGSFIEAWTSSPQL